MKRKRILVFLLGVLCFIVSQVLLRLPILNYLQDSPNFILYYTFNPLIIGLIIAFSAGVFEEGFRFIFKRFLIKPVKTDILEPILFGLGHGLVEALIVLEPFLQTTPIKSLALGIMERILAIILHIGLSVIVWNGFQKDERVKYLILAIVVHGAVNSLIPILGGAPWGILLIEGLLAIVAIVMLVYIYRSKKLYNLEEE